MTAGEMSIQERCYHEMGHAVVADEMGRTFQRIEWIRTTPPIARVVTSETSSYSLPWECQPGLAPPSSFDLAPLLGRCCRVTRSR